MESKNYYDILEVSVKASAQEITLAKNKLAKRYHPDVNMRNGIDTTDKMQEILEAYLVLSDPVKRAEYDREIRGNRPSKLQTFNLYEESEEVAALLTPQALLKCYVITHSFPVKSNVMRNIKRYNLFTHFPSRHRI